MGYVEVIAVVARGTGAISGLNRMGLTSHAGAGLERQQAKRTIAKVEGGDLAILLRDRRFPPFNDGGCIQRKGSCCISSTFKRCMHFVARYVFLVVINLLAPSIVRAAIEERRLIASGFRRFSI